MVEETRSKRQTAHELLEKRATPHDINHLGGFFFTPSSENTTIQAGQLRLLYSAMQKALEPQEERLLRQHWGIGVEKMTSEEIGAQLELSRQTINERVKKAEGKLERWFVRHRELMDDRKLPEFE